MTKSIKPVSFNDNNPDEKAMLKHVARKNFSGYVKKLIAKDMAVRTATSPPETQEEMPSRVEVEKPATQQTAAERLAAMKDRGNQPAPRLFNRPNG